MWEHEAPRTQEFWRERWSCAYGRVHLRAERCKCNGVDKGWVLLVNAIEQRRFRRLRDAQRAFAAIDKGAVALLQVYRIKNGRIAFK